MSKKHKVVRHRVTANQIADLEADAEAYQAASGKPFRTALKTVKSGKLRYEGTIMAADLKRKPRPRF